MVHLGVKVDPAIEIADMIAIGANSKWSRLRVESFRRSQINRVYVLGHVLSRFMGSFSIMTRCVIAPSIGTKAYEEGAGFNTRNATVLDCSRGPY